MCPRHRLCVSFVPLPGDFGHVLIWRPLQLEREWGALQISVIYIVSGFYGNVLSVLFSPESLSIGCSGAVFGQHDRQNEVYDRAGGIHED